MKVRSLLTVGVAALAVACSQQPAKQECPQLGISPEQFGTDTVDGQQVKLFTLRNANGMVAQFTNLGAKVVSLYAPDKQGNFADVVLGYGTAREYAACDNERGIGEPCFGATVGRYGNRIAHGKFKIDDKEYNLAVNEKALGNSLHGGFKGYFGVMWDAKQVSDSKIEFTRLSPDGEMGYPGNLDIKITYELTPDNALRIDYDATTDKPTVVNVTHHSFFNLAGEDSETVNDQTIEIPADNITPVDGNLIPTGDLMPVAGTPFDFRKPRVIGDSLGSEHPQMKFGNGYDHNFVLASEPDSTGMRLAARVKDPKSGRVMTVRTTEPGVQFYGGNFLNGSQKGKSGKGYPFRSALCLETQHFPDSPNHSNFPSTVLRPGERYKHTCIYQFSVE